VEQHNQGDAQDETKKNATGYWLVGVPDANERKGNI
jgi:hypothetical protein